MGSGPGVRVDHAQLHPSIDLAEFEQRRVIAVQPQEGEVSVQTITF